MTIQRILLICVAILGNSNHLSAQKKLFDSFGIKATLPGGWHVKFSDGMYGCYSENEQSVIVLFKNDNSMEYFKQLLPLGVDLGDGFIARSSGQFTTINSANIDFPVTLENSNGTTNAWGGMKQLKSGGVIGFLAISQLQLNETKNHMIGMLVSCEEVTGSYGNAAANYGESVNKWSQTLTGKKLESTGETGSSGYMTQSYYHFCSDRTYKYVYVFMSTISEPSEDVTYGRWDLVSRGAIIILILHPDNKEQENIRLGNKEGVIFFGNSKYYLTESRANCN